VRPIKILVVDDFEEFRRFVCALLRPKTEFEVTEASDGLEAVRKADELQPHLILLDIALPSLNGLEVARRIREFAPRTKILFLSSESSPDVVREALRLGALGYVHKPELQTHLVPAMEAVFKGELFVSRDLKLNGMSDANPFG
jgi:DNA-binding NarL/FixJ family response regulator